MGSRVRLQQPRLPTAVWTVTDLAGRFVLHLGVALARRHDHRRAHRRAAWRHEPPDPRADRLGPLSGIGWLLSRSLTTRYVESEAVSIKRAAETSTA